MLAALQFFIYRCQYYIVHVRKCTNNTQMNSVAVHSRYRTYSYAFQVSLKSHYWLEGFLDCSLCCSTTLFSAILWKFLSGILELTQRYPSSHIPKLAVDVQHASKLPAAIVVSQTGDGALYYLCFYQYVLVSINNVLAFMSQVKTFNT